MFTIVLLSLFTINKATDTVVGSAQACTQEWNPVCCPDPRQVELSSASDYREYGNVCEYGYGTDENGRPEDPIACGYGTCPVCMCAMIYSPVCCSDGVEYANQCEADCEGASGCSTGQCPDTCPCTAEYRPVCCPDKGKEYSNPCAASCELTDAELIACEYGTCEEPEDVCACTMEYDPQCCLGVDYANPCVARCEGATECTPGECKICTCTMESNPVCCPGNKYAPPPKDVDKTYGNPCQAHCERTEEELLACYYGECPACACPMIFAPTCCGGKQYGNECEAECVGATGCTGLPCPVPSDDTPQGIEPSDSDDSNDDYNEESDDEDDDSSAGKGKSKGTISCPDGCTQSGKKCVDNDGNTCVSSAAFVSNSVENCVCNAIYDPVCCSGTNYGNQCEADCDGATDCSDSECESNLCVCTTEFNPVCCPDDDGNMMEQFSNPCTAACSKTDAELIACEYRQCDSVCACTAIYDPVCCGGITYPSLCTAECSGVREDECNSGECPTICTLEYAPVCCSGVEYSNPCLAEAADASNCESGTCEEECACTLEYIPVCCGEKTYGNVCAANCANEDLVACEYGECEDTCDCKKDKYKPVCCDGDEYRNMCVAKCAGENKNNCDNGVCDSSDDSSDEYSAGAAFGVNGENPSGLYEYGFNINTILLLAILASMITFIYIYYKRTDPANFKKQINYDSDQ